MIVSCSQPLISETNNVSPAFTTEEPNSNSLVIQEIEVIDIPMPMPLDKPNAEISGMAWYGDNLILLPQYPNRFKGEEAGSLFYIQKQELLSYVHGPDNQVISINEIPFDDGGVSSLLTGFEGFEAIAFSGDRFYLTIETKPDEEMMGYLIAGTVDTDLSHMSLNPDKMIELAPQDDFTNASDEAIFIFEEKLYSIFEDNGKIVNPDPIVHVFDLDLNPLETLKIDNIEYRITDASEVEDDGYFWVMNYFFPGDVQLDQPEDPLVVRFGEGETHASNEPVERILKMQITQADIRLLEEEPIYLKLLNDNEARNWEALATLDDIGFIIATDKFPKTLLGFVRFLR